MKKMTKQHTRLLITGLLLMGIGSIIHPIIAINENIIDFFKGVGVAFILGSFWLSLRKQKPNGV